MTDRRRRSPTEMSGRRPRAAGGTSEGKPHARQTATACDDHTEHSIVALMEEVLSRENMLAAYRRVVGNKGAPGIDGMTVSDLEAHLRDDWEAIRNELLSGTYLSLIHISEPTRPY